MKNLFGTTKEGIDIYEYTLVNKLGSIAKFINIGAALVSLEIKDKDGYLRDVVLGFDNVAGYENNGPFFGTVVGPSANRVEGATFNIDGNRYNLDVNENENNLHSHFKKGLHNRIWTATEGNGEILFEITQEDGEIGFPGNRTFSIAYILTDENELILKYEGISDKNTLMNLTNHTYFNLTGGGNILDHSMMLNSDTYTPVKKGGIPLGIIESTKGTPLDFTVEKKVGIEIDSDFEQMDICGGYDHNYMVKACGDDGSINYFGYLRDKKSGICMEVYTDLPGVQIYSGNFIKNQMGKRGQVYGRRSGICFETQYPANSINQNGFPNVIFGPKRDYLSTTIYKFKVKS